MEKGKEKREGKEEIIKMNNQFQLLPTMSRSLFKSSLVVSKASGNSMQLNKKLKTSPSGKDFVSKLKA